jgi:thiol-disulfide isomerase/thioredoxin
MRGSPFSTRQTLTALAVSMLLPAAQGAAQLSRTPPQAPSKGDVIPAFETLGIDGKPWTLDFPKGSKTVLLFFLSGCPSCKTLMPEWNRAYERRSKDLRIVGVILDREPPGFWSLVPVSFPVVRSPGNPFMRSLNVNRVPLTRRVGEGGQVEDLALGAVDPIRLGELFAPPR